MKKVLVTGASGFIGSNLTKRLLSLGYEVYYTGRPNENVDIIGGTKIGDAFSDIDFFKIPKLDVIFHQAAITDTLYKNRDQMFRVNVHEPIEMFMNAIKQGCKKIVYASSCSVYGNGETPFRESQEPRTLNIYAQSKIMLDQEAKKINNAQVIGLRYSNVYGPGEQHKRHYASMIHKLSEQILKKQDPMLYEYGEQKRDFVYVEDIVDLNIAAAKADATGVFNGGSGVATSYNEIVGVINQKLGTFRRIEYIRNPDPKAFQTHTECDMSLTKDKLHFVPKWSIEEGIEHYLRARGEQIKKNDILFENTI